MVRAAVRPLHDRIVGAIARGVLRRVVSDDKGLQELQLSLLAGEVRGRVERMQEYGFSSVPLEPDGAGAAEALVAFVAGNRAHGVVVALDDRRHRPQGLAAGEVVVYDQHGSEVRLRADGTVRVRSDARVDVEAGAATLSLDPEDGLEVDVGGAPIVFRGGSFTVNAPSVDFDA